MGGGSTKSQQNAEYPPEFRPLAEGAVSQILDMQQRLPVSSFTKYMPAGTAGISPLQEFAINNLVPGTFAPTAGMLSGMEAGGAIGEAARGVAGASGPTQASQSALDTLGRRLAGPVGQLPSTEAYQQWFAQSLPGQRSLPTVFGGLSPETVSTEFADMASRGVPVVGGPPGVEFIDPTGKNPELSQDPLADFRKRVQQQMYLAMLQQRGMAPPAPEPAPVPDAGYPPPL